MYYYLYKILLHKWNSRIENGDWQLVHVEEIPDNREIVSERPEFLVALTPDETLKRNVIVFSSETLTQ